MPEEQCTELPSDHSETHPAVDGSDDAPAEDVPDGFDTCHNPEDSGK